ncbi:MAG: ribonuclease III [Deltaproteobacteria bacterium]
MKLGAELVAFCARIQYTFKRPELLHEAVTHGSFAEGTRADNQRLEFLGDRVLGLSIAEALLAIDPAANEGQLAPRLNALVRKETCADVARDIGLGDVLRLGRSEMLSGGRRKETLLGDAMEAIIAAVYLDSGYEPARDLILRLWKTRIASVEADSKDPKTTLQEWAQARALGIPAYDVVARDGPAHAPQFRIAVRLAEHQAEAAAGTKRQAEQDAARVLLAELRGTDD